MKMEKRHSVLDSGLEELADAADQEELLMSDSVVSPSTSTVALESMPRARGLVHRPATIMPSEKLTVKLVAAAGAVQAMMPALAEMGVDILSCGPQVVLANVPREQLKALSNLPGLRRAEQSHRLQFRLDAARGVATRADIGLAQFPAIRGQGVVVGIVDSGVDWRHDDFRRDDGSTRIEMFVHAVHDPATGTDRFQQFHSADIDAALAGNGIVPDGDPNGHGTHCGSIAAGNGRAAADARYRGLAPEATLMAVRSDTLHDTHIIEGIRRVFAAAGDRPAVVNLSLGGQFGPHDGTSALENVISRETGPGRIVVVAAGNEAQDRIHFDGQLVEGQALDIEFTIRDGLQFIDVWIPRGDEADLSVIDPHGVETDLDGTIQQTAAGAFRADLREDQVNRDVNLTFAVAARQTGRRWRLRLAAQKVRHGNVHAWGLTENPVRGRDIFMSETSLRYSIGMPATEERAISVASFISRAGVLPDSAPVGGLTEGAISPFSGRGPARLGALRPDIAAPGQHIVAALAGGSELATDPRYAARRLSGNQYISIQGTSMATPFVTGAVALMLQQEPDLGPEDVQLRLRATARRDADTGQVWNPAFGFGKIDVEALLNYSTVV